MRVYAESNFVLELVLEQEQGSACEQIVSHAESRVIELALPAYALLEPYQTIIRRENDRKALIRAIRLERAQLQRTASLAPDTARLQDADDLLLRASQGAFARFSDVRARLLLGAEILVVDANVLKTAGVDASRFGLPFPDAVMVAAVYHDAAKRKTPSVFLNRNTKEFLDPDVKHYLASVNCIVIGSFANGLARINSALAAPKYWGAAPAARSALSCAIRACLAAVSSRNHAQRRSDLVTVPLQWETSCPTRSW